MSLLSQRKLIFVATETTQNTAVSVAATDAIEAYDVESAPDSEILERNPHSDSLDRTAHLLGKAWQEKKLTVDLKGSGTAGTAYAPLGALLQACGFVETAVASNTVQSVAVTAGGTGYTSASVLTFSGGSGTGAAGFPVVVGGAVVAIVITNPGSGYVSDPTPAVSVGSGATFTVTRGGSVAYNLASVAASANFFGPGKSCTVKLYEHGMLKVLAGCIGDPKFILEAGKIAKLEVSLKGIYAAVADDSFPTDTPNDTSPLKFESSNLYAHHYAAVISKLELALNNQVSERPDSRNAYSIGGFQNTGRNPGGSFDPEAVLVATHDFYGAFRAGTEGPLSFQLGSTAGNRIQIGCPKTQYGKIGTTDQNGIMRFSTPLMLNKNTGDDSLSIVMT